MANKKIIPPMPFDATAWLSNNAAMRLSFACKGLWLEYVGEYRAWGYDETYWRCVHG